MPTLNFLPNPGNPEHRDGGVVQVPGAALSEAC